MLVRQLSYFVTLARERHFARAAEACNIAQPTLSAAIRKLEEDLDAQLVVRSHKFVGLTPEGEKLLIWGRQILTDYNSLREDLSGLRSGLTGTLRLGVIPAAMPMVALLSASFLRLIMEMTPCPTCAPTRPNPSCAAAALPCRRSSLWRRRAHC